MSYLIFRNSMVAVLFLFFACKNDPRPLLEIRVGQTELRREPGEKGEPFLILKKGQTVRSFDETSSFFSKIELESQPFFEPWVLVESPDGQKGWLFCGAVSPPKKDDNWLIFRRLQSFFGNELAAKTALFQKKKGQPKSAAEFADEFRLGKAVANLMNEKLPQKLTADEPGELPDFFWLESAMPGFIAQKVAEETMFQLFADFRFWLKKAAATPQPDDDAFIQTWLAAFPTDSIESFFPSSKIQLTDYEGASLLGSGNHLRRLESMANCLKISELFRADLEIQKAEILRDISDRSVKYWLPAEKIRAELDQIRAAGFPFFTQPDLIELDERRRQMDDPAANGIQVNLRAGGS